ncbi:MAG: flagellar basal body rod protein FlgB [Alphaproteobacteria bacterium]|nr:flagellar basal body rod protein FlgB [Alphaproteobacteria bacterium]
MDLQQYTLFGMIKERMAWATKREHVLSRNIANADTPGFLPSDIRELTFKKALSEAAPPQVSVTDPGHMAGTPVPTSRFRIEKQRAPEEISPNGNGVTLEEQMMKVGDTKGKFDMAANLYQKNLAFLKMATGGGR